MTNLGRGAHITVTATSDFKQLLADLKALKQEFRGLDISKLNAALKPLETRLASIARTFKGRELIEPFRSQFEEMQQIVQDIKDEVSSITVEISDEEVDAFNERLKESKKILQELNEIAKVHGPTDFADPEATARVQQLSTRLRELRGEVTKVTPAEEKAAKAAAELAKAEAAGVAPIAKSVQLIQARGKLIVRAAQDDAKLAAEQRKLFQAFGQANLAAQEQVNKLRILAGQPVINQKQVALAVQLLKQLKKELADLSRTPAGVNKAVDAEVARIKQNLLGVEQALGIVGENSSLADIQKDLEGGEKPTNKFKEALGELNESLGSVGLNISGISVLLGAGFAGGLAGIIKIIADLAGNVKEFNKQFQEIDKESKRAFGAASKNVEEFSSRLASSLNRSRIPIQTAINDFGAFARVLNITGQAAVPFAEGFGTLAEELKDLLPGFKDTADVTQTLQAAINGSTEALAKLGLRTTDFAKISEDTFGRAFEHLSPYQRALILLPELQDRVGESLEKVGADAPNVWERIAEAARDVTDETINSFRKFTDEQLQEARAFLKTQAEASDVARVQLQRIDAEIRRRKELIKTQEDTRTSLEKLLEVQKLAEEQFLLNAQAMRQVEDAARNLTRAQEDAAVRQAEALTQLQRAREDAVKRESEVIRDNRRSLEDANRRIEDANIQAQRATEDRLREIEKVEFEFRRDIADIRQEHERETDDLNREHNRKLKDFAEKEKKIQRDRVRSNIEALNSLFEAQLKGDIFAENSARRRLQEQGLQGRENAQDLERERIEELEDFRIKKEREREDFEEDLKETREDRIRELHDIEIESTRELIDANRDLQEALLERQRAFEDAITSLNEVEVENNRALFDAQKAITDSQREARRAIEDTRLSLSRMAEDYGVTLDFIERIVTGLQQWKKIQDLIAEGANIFDSSVPFSPGFVPPGGASGFSNFPGGLAMVGERGRELVNLPRGSDVIPNDRTERILSLLERGGTSITVNQVANDPEATAFAVSARWARSLNN